MELKSGYKLTDVGVIPTDWEVSTAVEVCEMVVDCKNRTPPVVDSGEFAVVRTPNVRNGQFVWNELRFTDEKSFHTWTERTIPQVGDILITREAPLGEVCLVPPGLRLCLGQRMMLYRPSAKRISSEYLLYALMSTAVRSNLLKKIGGSTVGHAKVNDIRILQIPLPPAIEEQRAIATALSDVNALLAKLDQIITKRRDLKQAAMQQLLTGQTRLPGFSADWVSKAIGEVAQIPVTDGPHLTPKFLADGVPFLSVNNLVENRIDFEDVRYISKDDHELFSRKCKPQKHDLLLGKAASVGKIAIVDTDVEFNIWSPIALIRLNDSAIPLFIYYCMQGEAVLGQIGILTNSSSQGNIGMGDIERLKLDLPPVDEQTAIATVLSDMDAELGALQARRAKTQAIKQGMMQELLTGRIRLV